MADWFDEEIGKVMKARQTLRRSAIPADRILLEDIEWWLGVIGKGLPASDRTFINKQYKLVSVCKERGFGLPVLEALHPISCQGNVWYCFPDTPASFDASSLRTVYANACSYMNAACSELRQMTQVTVPDSHFEKWFGTADHVAKVRANFTRMQAALKNKPLILAKMPEGRGFDHAFGAAMPRGEVVNLAYGERTTLHVVYIGNIFWESPGAASLAEIELAFGNDETPLYNGYLKEHTLIHEMSHLAVNTEDITVEQYNPNMISGLPKGEGTDRITTFLNAKKKLKKYYAGHEANIETFYGSPLSKILARGRPDLAAKNADNYAYYALQCGVPGLRARFVKRDAQYLPDPTD